MAFYVNSVPLAFGKKEKKIEYVVVWCYQPEVNVQDLILCFWCTEYKEIGYFKKIWYIAHMRIMGWKSENILAWNHFV